MFCWGVASDQFRWCGGGNISSFHSLYKISHRHLPVCRWEHFNAWNCAHVHCNGACLPLMAGFCRAEAPSVHMQVTIRSRRVRTCRCLAIQSVNTVLHFNTPCLHFSGRFLLGSSTTMYNSKPTLCLLDVAQVNCTILPSDQVAKSTYEIGRDAQRASCLDYTKVVHLFFCFHALFATMWCRIRRWSESED